MFLSGIADEAGKPIEVQVKAHKELKWEHIELRTVEGVNVTDLSDAEFEKVYAVVSEAGLKVSCFASQIANWARPISGDFSLDLEELKRAVPRMHRFGTQFIRCMSWPNDKKQPWPEAAWKEEVIKRMKELTKIAEDSEVILVHENCDGWAGQGPDETLELLEEVGSPALKLVFDTGNPVEHGQDGWDFYQRVRDNIVYVHIKDYKEEGGGKSACFPGEGQGHVREIIKDLLSRGYTGGFSIEPHLAAVIHLAKDAEDPEEAYRLYIEYGRRLEKLVQEIQGQASQ